MEQVTTRRSLMRRPLLLVLLTLCLVIVFLYFTDPFGLGTATGIEIG